MPQPKTLHVALLALTLSLPAFLTAGVASAQDFDSSGEQQMLARINAMRAAQNLPALTRDEGLDAAARAHTADMATQEALTHVSDTSGTPADRVRAAGVSAATVAENVALHRSTSEAHDALLGSDAHRGNMLSAGATHIGLAALATERGTYVTQVFASLAAPEAAAPEPVAPPAVVPPAVTQPTLPPPPAPLAGTDVVVPSAPQAPIAPSAPQAPTVQSNGDSFRIQPGSQGTVVVQRNAQDRVLAYWVLGSGRWWYYPFPPGARPGQQLQPDLSVQGPPPGFRAGPGAAPTLQGPPPQARPLPPPPGRQGVTIAPFQGRITIAPGTTFYSVPPPPMTGGRPTRVWRRQHRQWLRAYRRWQGQQRRVRRRAL